MSNDFRTLLFHPLSLSTDYKLTAVVELSRLSDDARTRLLQHFLHRALPLLSQSQFSNLRDKGPCLISYGRSGTINSQHELFDRLNLDAATAVRGWIFSRLPLPELAQHLSYANIISAPDGKDYLLNQHLENVITTLYARPDLPGVTEWLRPVHSWWVPVNRASGRRWQCIRGSDQPDQAVPYRLEIDRECWEDLQGDPLSYRLAEQLKVALAANQAPPMTYDQRIALARYHLAMARDAGLTSKDDLATYVIAKVLLGDDACATAQWEAAVTEAIEGIQPLAHALERRLPTEGNIPW